MSKQLSLYLDLIRFFSALGVFFTHLNFVNITGHLVWRLAGYGDICVVIFFVLSGYVIAHVTEIKERSFFLYFVSRFSRLYSVVIVSLLLTYFFDTYGSILNPSAYKTIEKNTTIIAYISSLFFINEYQIFSFGGIAPGTNGPFWSLSFEFSYYTIAALLIFSRPIYAIFFSTLILVAAGKTISILMPIWLLGFLLYKKKNTIPKIVKNYSSSIFILTFLALLLLPYANIPLFKYDIGIRFPYTFRLGDRNIIIDYVTAILFLIHLASAHFLKITIRSKFDEFIRWLGLLTFPMYCIHLPALYFFRAISPFEITTIYNTVYIAASVMSVVIIFTPICERFKVKIRVFLSKLSPRINIEKI